ncbi:MAG TPA: GxxExxY protein [Anaerolineales bacterium]
MEPNQITERIIGCVHRVSNTLGSGFLEKVYENALLLELGHCGLRAEQQHPIRVFYRNSLIGEFAADILVDNCVIVELKAVKTLDDVHTARCLNYLKATGMKICLLINFGKPRVDIKRIILGYLGEEPKMNANAHG